MNIVLVEPFYSGSHRIWADQLQEHSSHNIELITLPGRHWKWRMQSAAFPLAEKANRIKKVDLFLCTDMINVAEFRSFLNRDRKEIPIFLYMHENQITYPWSPDDKDISLKRDHTYGMINLISCINADRVFFNSNYHLQSFYSTLPSFLQKFPDSFFKKQIASLKNKSHILPIGIDLATDRKINTNISKPPVVLWNHRWEFDKGPEEFFQLLIRTQEQGIDFQLIVCGESARQIPESFHKAQAALRDKIIHWGFADNRTDYLQLLELSDVLPVTSHQDFFGISIIEAISYGNYPLLPDRLAYPEHIPPELHIEHLYHSIEELHEKLTAFLCAPQLFSPKIMDHINKYAWGNMIHQYDEALNIPRFK